MIQRILVPVDFGSGSAAALRYAEAFAAHVGARRVHVIHVFTPQLATADSITSTPVGELMEQREVAFEEFLAGIPATPGIERGHELHLGLAADKIVDCSDDFDLVIMGSTGETDVLEEVFGSISSAVVERAAADILLVPAGAVFRDYEHILYASNSLSLSRRAVLEFMDFNELFRARIHFVHVNDEEGTRAGDRENLFAPLFNDPDPEFNFDIEEVTADTVQEGLQNYLATRPIDLAVMVTKVRGFWGRLFHHSDTKQMVLHPKTPLLVLHVAG